MAGATVREIEGVLEEVDLKARSCRIRPARGRAVRAGFGPRQRQALTAALGRKVWASVASVPKPRSGGRVLVLRSVSVVDPRLAERLTPSSGQGTVAEFLESGLVGLWKDRTDIGDGAALSRKLRERTWKRG